MPQQIVIFRKEIITMSTSVKDPEFDDELGQLIKKSLKGHENDIDEKQKQRMGKSIIDEITGSKSGRGHEFDDLLEAAENQADVSAQLDM